MGWGKPIGMLKTILAACFLLTPALAAPLVTNGDFETGDLSGWNVDAGIITCFTDPSLAHTGSSGAAFLAFILPSQLSQVIATVPGHQYLVEFFAATVDSAFTSTFAASFAGGSLDLVPTLTTSYTRYTFLATASGSSDTLAFFTSPGTTVDTFLLDDISVTDLSAPELGGGLQPPLALAFLSLMLVNSKRARETG